MVCLQILGALIFVAWANGATLQEPGKGDSVAALVLESSCAFIHPSDFWPWYSKMIQCVTCNNVEKQFPSILICSVLYDLYEALCSQEFPW